MLKGGHMKKNNENSRQEYWFPKKQFFLDNLACWEEKDFLETLLVLLSPSSHPRSRWNYASWAQIQKLASGLPDSCT